MTVEKAGIGVPAPFDPVGTIQFAALPSVASGFVVLLSDVLNQRRPANTEDCNNAPFG